MPQAASPGKAPDAVMQALRAANEALQRDFLNVVKILSGLIDMRFTETAGHGRRCADLSERAAVQLNLPLAECIQIRYAALLHSLGKMTLSDALLAKKPRDMSSVELAQWQRYPGLSEEMLMGLSRFSGASRIIRAHQERWDGQGFPDGLRGTAIPIGARIVAAAIQMDRLRQGWDCERPQLAAEVEARLRQQQGKRLCAEASEALIASQRGVLLPEPTGRPAPQPPKEMAQRVDELQPGAVLSRDLVGVRGLLLLGANHQITRMVLEQLKRYEARHVVVLEAWIKAGGGTE